MELNFIIDVKFKNQAKRKNLKLFEKGTDKNLGVEIRSANVVESSTKQNKLSYQRMGLKLSMSELYQILFTRNTGLL